IRGVYPEDLNAESAELIGKGFGTYVVKTTGKKNPWVVVGRDGRTHGLELEEAFIKGLTETGCHVADIGLATSPFLYFVNTVGEFDAGCNVTASHNPRQYNGFKLILEKGHAVFGDDLQEIHGLIRDGKLVSGKGEKKTGDYRGSYAQKLGFMFRYPRPLKIVVDTANGVAGAYYPQILKALGHEVTGLYTELDGNFPNHEPDPIVEKNLEALKKKVVEIGADIGFAFDGDGDRVGLVTEKGEFINADKTLMLLAKDALSRHKGRAAVFTVSNSQTLFELVKQWGGRPVMCKVGHSFVEAAMHENDAVVGGEQSGHFFLPENYYPYDDALVTACRILMIATKSDKPVSALFEEFPKTYSEPEMRPYCDDEAKFEVLEKVQDHFRDKYPNTTLDGIRLDFGHGGWAGIRVSNTSPCLSVTMEAQTQKHLEEIKAIVLGHLKAYPEIRWEA
ncbi:phosphomannomutase/phosphoglucomutase, partial [Candidatus Peregrinibacteria bacterium]|nr:phosphomannomutase/phosphoglucomutase [Candidatus Peregrinibacteria bacterium]